MTPAGVQSFRQAYQIVKNNYAQPVNDHNSIYQGAHAEGTGYAFYLLRAAGLCSHAAAVRSLMGRTKPLEHLTCFTTLLVRRNKAWSRLVIKKYKGD
jgi:hypothetical protein